MIRFRQKGDFSKLTRYFERVKEKVRLEDLDKYGREGVAALASATPVDSGLTASSWYYEIERQNGSATITFKGLLKPAILMTHVKLNVYFSLELIKAYTNINITEKMMETAPKTYDILVMNHILENVIHAIPEEEYNCIYDATYECGKNAVQFLTSLMGMFKTIAQDYQDTNINMNELMQVLDQPDKVGFVKDVLDKLG